MSNDGSFQIRRTLRALDREDEAMQAMIDMAEPDENGELVIRVVTCEAIE